jgi:hypothetical protein
LLPQQGEDLRTVDQIAARHAARFDGEAVKPFEGDELHQPRRPLARAGEELQARADAQACSGGLPGCGDRGGEALLAG